MSVRHFSAPTTGVARVALLALAVSCRRSAPELQPVAWVEWGQVLRSERGNVLVVNVWANWCRTCIELFPSLVEMSRQYEPQRVRFISLSLDDSNDKSACQRAQQFLEGQRADFAHYVSTGNFAATLANLEVDSVPVVLVYAADGQLRYRLVGDEPDNEISPADVRDAIDSLVDEMEPLP